MEGNRNFPARGENDVAPITTEPYSNDLDELERIALSDRLHDLADQLHEELHDLADRTRHNSGELSTEEALAVRARLSETDRTLRRELGAIAPVGDRIAHRSRGRDAPDSKIPETFSPATREELAEAIEEDLDQLRGAVERASHGLVTETLTDEEVSDVWDGAARVEAWGRDVLTHRVDQYVEIPEEELKEATEPVEEISTEELGI
jgi:hypothetical protein